MVQKYFRHNKENTVLKISTKSFEYYLEEFMGEIIALSKTSLSWFSNDK